MIAVLGPRQVGKTTVVRQALDQVERGSRYLPVDESDPLDRGAPEDPFAAGAARAPQARDTRWLLENWEDARRRAERLERGFVLALDEIQKIPNWSDTVKGLWDADRARGCPLHVVIICSAPLTVRSGLTESMAGRFEPLRLTHWSLPEMSSAFGFGLPQHLFFGGYPGAAGLIRHEDRWRDYVLDALIGPNIERDILAITRVGKPALLKRLFDLGAMHSGQVLSYNKMVGQLGEAGTVTTLARYLDLLSRAGLLTGLSKYSDQHSWRRESSPKLNVLNTALMTAGSGYSFNEAMADRTFWGRITESAIGAHLFNSAAPGIGVHYWRENSREVDFVLRRGPRLVAIEVRSGPRRTANAGGMAEFEGRFEAVRRVLVGEGGVPVEEFLSVPAAEWFERS